MLQISADWPALKLKISNFCWSAILADFAWLATTTRSAEELQWEFPPGPKMALQHLGRNPLTSAIPAFVDETTPRVGEMPWHSSSQEKSERARTVLATSDAIGPAVQLSGESRPQLGMLRMSQRCSWVSRCESLVRV